MRSILLKIAADNGLAVSTMHIQQDAVFYKRDEQLLCFCQIGSAYWHEVQAAILTEKIIASAKAL